MKSLREKAGFFIIIIVVIVVVLAGFLWWDFRANRVADLPSVPPATASPAGDQAPDMPLAASLAQKLEIPWALDFLPDGSLVFTERPGRVRLIDVREGLLPEPLLGIAVHPDFASNHFIYVYYTHQGENPANRVVRFRKENNTLLDKKIILDNIPAASNHNGGRIKFGPDGLLYITTGDASVAELAQDRNSLAGKILRLKDDGTIPSGNPFAGSPVYSLGHRNPQGLAWDAQGVPTADDDQVIRINPEKL